MRYDAMKKEIKSSAISIVCLISVFGVKAYSAI